MKNILVLLLLFVYVNSFSQVKDIVNIVNDSINGINSQIVLEKISKNKLRVVVLNIMTQQNDTLSITITKNDTTAKFLLKDSIFSNLLLDKNIFNNKSIFLNKLDSISLKSLSTYNFIPVIENTDNSQPAIETKITFFDKLLQCIANNFIIITLVILNLFLSIIIIFYYKRLKKIRLDYNLLSDLEKVKQHFNNYKFNFTKKTLKDRIDELYKQYTESIEENIKLEENSKILVKEKNKINIEKEKLISTFQIINEKLLSTQNDIQNKIIIISDLEKTTNILKEDLNKEKSKQSEVINTANLLIKKFNNKSQEIQELASKESIEEAKKSYVKALVFMTFHSRSLIKKIIESDSKYDSMNIDLLNDKIVKPNNIITSNVKYDDVDHLVYVTLKTFKDYKINQINDVFFNGDQINEK